MNFDAILPHLRIEQMRASGYWNDSILTDYWDGAVSRHPEKSAVIEYKVATGSRTCLSYRSLDLLVTRASVALSDFGIERNDVVSCQLPNWWQFVALSLACIRIGAVINPLMPIFRERELSFMLGLTESKLLVLPGTFRKFDHAQMEDALSNKLPNLQRTIVIDSCTDHLFYQRWDSQSDYIRLFAKRRPSSDDVTQILFTSGTTGEPKGVMHTANTLLSTIPAYIKRLRLNSDDVIFMASPLAHQTGFMYGLMMPIMLGATAVLQDVWDPKCALHAMNTEGVTYTMASTPFLSDLTDAVAASGTPLSTLRVFHSAGAPIPRSLVMRATEALGAQIISGWGMTENGAVTTTKPDDAPEKVFHTDGCAIPGMEVAVFDDDNQRLPFGSEGRLKARGSANFVGYLKRPNYYATDQEGWFDTGDLARIDPDGYVRITGRLKDIVIRGGENIPVVEIENLLYQHPSIQSVAIIGLPDSRLGERACAFVTLRPGTSLTLADVISFLSEKLVAKTYLPERLEIVDEMPRTPSGKIQKFKLRQLNI